MTEGDLDFNIHLDKTSTSGGGTHREGIAPGQQVEKTQGLNNQFKEKLPTFLQESSHPGICVVHFIFKLLALVFYLLLNIFISNLILTYIIVLVLCAVDFWVVKNVTGRILVGLRWWTEIKEDGTEEWVFESLDQKSVNKSDNRVFWATTYAAPIFWMAFIVVSIFKFSIQNVTICIIAFVLSSTNLYGYQKCERNHQAKVKGFIFNQAKDRISVNQMAQIGTMAAQYAKK